MSTKVRPVSAMPPKMRPVSTEMQSFPPSLDANLPALLHVGGMQTHISHAIHRFSLVEMERQALLRTWIS